MNGTPAPASRNASMFPRIIFAYMAVFQVILLVLAYFLYQDAAPGFRLFTDQTSLALLAGGIVTFALGFVTPRLMTRRIKLPGAGTSHPLSGVIAPYMVRLCFFEFCSLLGFVSALLHRDWLFIVPFVTLGLLGTALSAPTEAFFNRLRSPR